MKHFLIKISTSAAVVIIIVSFLNIIYKANDKTDIDGTLKFKNIKENIQICNTGSSHGVYNICYDDVKNYNCFNFSLESQSLDYDYRILANYVGKLSEGAIIFIPVSYFSFLGMPEEKSEDFDSINQRYYKILPDSMIKDFDIREGILAKCPVITSYDQIIRVFLGVEHKVHSESWDLQTADSIDLKSSVESAYDRHYIINKVDENGVRIINDQNVEAVYKIITLCQDRGFRPILITTPLLTEYIEKVEEKSPDVLTEFRTEIDKITRETNVEYYDFSHDERFVYYHEKFMDGDHLNKTGAREFTSILINDIVEK